MEHRDPQCCLGTSPLTPDEAACYAGLFRVLADPARLELLSHIAAEGCRPMGVGELASLVGLSQPTVSHHLKKLAEAGLVDRVAQGRSTIHVVVPEAFARLRRVLDVGL
ncbi:ArsR/SmtB family transcription factor [Corynebacterium liangguodongii]|uniref:Transcriptional regulator n=1 Tax=Corynebacterium liangguodongii TaxID=2079535 RepID=A0A2S0WHF1_9CORY|nr:metalloregulator ArsR/SmtB family transcription factor [Corynebacterium liangguodongii]AWB85156.1 transcriptional regulator [Corynebacterium liangguodongii]PWB99781.1 ArsR family transcriptional regulator [Corynebacterium liangguodongii]